MLFFASAYLRIASSHYWLLISDDGAKVLIFGNEGLRKKRFEKFNPTNPINWIKVIQERSYIDTLLGKIFLL